MAFKFHWPIFEEKFVEKARIEVERALNSKGGQRLSAMVDTIYVKELYFGNAPPELEILELGELSEGKFKAFFKLVYDGDAHILLQTKVQANPVSTSALRSKFTEIDIFAADKPLVLPMQLTISRLKFSGILSMSMCKKKGCSLTFKNDPIQSVHVSSTFDNLPNIRRYLQNEIESHLRWTVIEVIPELIHTLSKSWLRRNEFTDGLSSPSFDMSRWTNYSHISDNLNTSRSSIHTLDEDIDMDRYRFHHKHTPYWTPQRSPDESPQSSSLGHGNAPVLVYLDNFDAISQDLYHIAPERQKIILEYMLAPENNSLTSQLATLTSNSQTLAIDSRPTIHVASINASFG
jgi:hypothetical protein